MTTSWALTPLGSIFIEAPISRTLLRCYTLRLSVPLSFRSSGSFPPPMALWTASTSITEPQAVLGTT
ncbi:unnamed protein product [Timema podura]|uniref:Uncharacterized protein n=1 Tax=Timema podura TaxID=61482 RepID=A0ABN7PL13_TIMPD|nr:unnamed protein product [Timema podura]